MEHHKIEEKELKLNFDCVNQNSKQNFDCLEQRLSALCTLQKHSLLLSSIYACCTYHYSYIVFKWKCIFYLPTLPLLCLLLPRPAPDELSFTSKSSCRKTTCKLLIQCYLSSLHNAVRIGLGLSGPNTGGGGNRGRWLVGTRVGTEDSPHCSFTSAVSEGGAGMPAPSPTSQLSGMSQWRLWAAMRGGSTLGGGSKWLEAWTGECNIVAWKQVPPLQSRALRATSEKHVFSIPTFPQSEWVSWVNASHLTFKSLASGVWKLLGHLHCFHPVLNILIDSWTPVLWFLNGSAATSVLLLAWIKISFLLIHKKPLSVWVWWEAGHYFILLLIFIKD